MTPLTSASNFRDVAAFFIGYINLLIPLLVTIALVFLMYSGFRYVVKASETAGKGPEREAILWGLIALFIILSVWGILRIMCNTFIGSASCSTGGANSFPSAAQTGGSPLIQIPH